MKFKYATVITGSIGSGKSTFANLLKQSGYAVIDADEISHEQLEICADEVAQKFGDEILNESRNLVKINRKKLGNIVFSDKEKLAWLENLLHPKIMAEIYRRCEILESEKRLYFVDIPLYFEGLGRDDYKFARVALVYAPKISSIKRIMKRNDLSFDEAKARVELQIDIEKKREMADLVIDNGSNLQDLKARTMEFLARLKEKALKF